MGSSRTHFLADYLGRIGYAGSTEPTVDTLVAVHRAQAYSIPFENFDITDGGGISLLPDDLVDKLVRRRRGGYCFELNGLLIMALQALGFQARPLLARVHLRDEPTGRGHQLALVTIGGADWIADVGFGANGLRAPIPLQIGATEEQDGQQFRLVDAGVYGTMLQVAIEENWQNLYSLELSHVCSADIEMGNHHTSTHPSSLFTRIRVATLPTPQGRVSLLDQRLKIETHGKTTEIELPEDQGFWASIEEHFGIEFSGG